MPETRERPPPVGLRDGGRSCSPDPPPLRSRRRPLPGSGQMYPRLSGPLTVWRGQPGPAQTRCLRGSQIPTHPVSPSTIRPDCQFRRCSADPGREPRLTPNSGSIQAGSTPMVTPWLPPAQPSVTSSPPPSAPNEPGTGGHKNNSPAGWAGPCQPSESWRPAGDVPRWTTCRHCAKRSRSRSLNWCVALPRRTWPVSACDRPVTGKRWKRWPDCRTMR